MNEEEIKLLNKIEELPRELNIEIRGLILAGVKRIFDNKLEMSTSETVEQATKQYYLDNDSVLAYLNDYPTINNNPVVTVYEAYEEYCEDSNLKAVSRTKFSRRLISLGYTIVSTTMLGKKVRLIRKI